MSTNGIKKWAKEELDLFKTDLTNVQISKKTGRTKSSVENRRYMLRQKGTKVGGETPKIKFWTIEEINLFQEGLGDTAISKKIGRTRTSVSVKRNEIKKRGLEQVLASANRINREIKGKISISKPKISEKIITKAAKAKVIASTDLHFVVNGLNLYVANTCTNVLIGKNKVEVNF